MVQTVSRRPLTAKTGVRARVSPCGIFGEQSGTATDFSPSCLVFTSQYHLCRGSAYSYVIWGINNRPGGGRSSET
jgi:hypothetical protein